MHSSTPRSWLRKPEDMLAMLAISATTFLKVRLVSALWQVTMKLLNSVLSGVKLQRAAKGIANIFKNACSNSGQSGQVLAMTMRCSFFLPQCSNGERVYPCKRVCNEFLKQCEKGIPEFWFAFLVASCHVLPDEASSSGKCHEPPNFSVANDSNKGG